MLSDLQKKTAQAIVQVFETSTVLGDYAKVTLLDGDTGGLTYGKAQTTLNSGNLAKLIDEYCSAPGAGFAAELTPHLARFELKDQTLNRDQGVHLLLEKAGDDAVMQDVQDAFFDRVYWRPVEMNESYYGLNTALGHSIIYDSQIHGSLNRVTIMTNEATGKTPKEMGTRDWLKAYVRTRKNWLATHSNTLLHKTVYRMKGFEQLIKADNWDLVTPFKVHGVEITKEALNAPPPQRGIRILKLTSPMMSGWDVKELQMALIGAGHAVSVGKADGIFGRDTDTAVKRFQKNAGLQVDGQAGEATRRALGLSF